MLLHGGFQRLRIGLYVPHSYHAFAAAANYLAAIGRARDCRHATMMRVIYGEHDFARLRVEAAYFAIVPAAYDRRAVAGKYYRRAGFVGHFNAEQLLIGRRMPHAYVLIGACGEQL